MRIAFVVAGGVDRSGRESVTPAILLGAFVDRGDWEGQPGAVDTSRRQSWIRKAEESCH